MVEQGSTSGPVLLYDGACGFCSETVRFVLHHDRRGTLRFAPLQGRWAAQLIARHPDLADIDSLLWVETRADGAERVLARSAAALRVARYLGGPWRLALVAWLSPRVARDWAYDLVARHRHQLFSPAETCFVPPREVRARFLDSARPGR